MKKFASFMEDGGAAPATGTAGVAGAGDNPSKIVPVSKKRQNTYQAKGSAEEQQYVHDANRQMRKMTGGINIK